VETPAAVIISDLLLKECDFLSVGTNDLTQYTLALDRGNARLARRFSPLHPAVIRLLRDVREAAARAGKPIAVCGELAGEPLGSFLLVGLGYRLLSVSPPTLPLVRWLVRQFDAKGAAAAVREAMEVDDAAAVSRVLEEHLSEIIDLHMLDAGWLPKRRAQTTLR
jgi:phosphoenolpyruvate-protein kinase (PTS system EI component)